jgi:hypothetical protein
MEMKSTKSKVHAIRERYTRTQRTLYALKRYMIFFVILLPSLWWLAYIDPAKTDSSLLLLLVTRIARSTIGICLAMLFMKFAFPRVALQTELIDDNNVAVALIFAAIIIGVNL